ncbi:MAG: methionine--tRNA ligase [Patescibacteria group bacterium]
MKTVFLSTSIPYVNAKPHIGFAFEAVQSDVLVRSFRASGAQVYFTTGTDENAQKNVESAEKAGKPVQEFVDANAKTFENLCSKLDISNDTFIRTTSDMHKKGAQKLWSLCEKDIYKKTYSGLYCVGCETFYEDGEFEGNVCPNHNRKLELVEEENYFFSLSKYQSQIEELLTSEKLKILPSYRKDELLNFVKKGLRDFSISRPTKRVKGWGIPVPNDDDQRMYVWYDALSNYITALGFGVEDNDKYMKYWNDSDVRIHVIGKDIIKFHGIYWPAMLMSANLPLPTHLFTHGFITVDGQKMSKSLGNVVDPIELIEKYGLDAVRYYLAREIPMHDDGDYSDTRMKQLFTADLANELGNLVSRSLAIAAKDEITVEAISTNKTVPSDTECVFNYQKKLENVWLEIRSINKSFNEFAPWAVDASGRKEFMINVINRLQAIAEDLKSYIPKTAEKIKVKSTGKIEKTEPLFPRI